MTGTGFDSPDFGGLLELSSLQCPPQFGERLTFGVQEVLNSCAFIGTDFATVDSAGNLTDTVTVHEGIVPATNPQAPYDCTVGDDCVVIVADLCSAGLCGAAASISFGPDVPKTKADCKSGGWRTVTAAQGQPFRNQGQCVSYVVAQRR